MNKIDRIKKEEKECYTSRTANYIADTIAINYKNYRNKHKISFETFYKQGFDVFIYNEREKQETYDLIEDSLQKNYGLIRINKGYDEQLVLKDLNEEE